MDDIDILGYAAWVEYYHLVKTRTTIRYNERTGYADNKYYKRFRQIGEQCKKLNIDPADYMRIAFDLINDNYKYFTPMDFASPRLFTAYREHKDKYGVPHLTVWTTQINNLVQIECMRKSNEQETEEDILISGMHSFVAWFRLFYLPKFSERIFEIYGKAAWFELQADKPLRLFLRQQRPTHLAELEKRIAGFGDLKESDICNGTVAQRIQPGLSDKTVTPPVS